MSEEPKYPEAEVSVLHEGDVSATYILRRTWSELRNVGVSAEELYTFLREAEEVFPLTREHVIQTCRRWATVN